MKIRIEIVDNINEDEIIIRCGRVDDNISKIQQYLIEQNLSVAKITFYKGNKEFYFPLDEVLFFETDDEYVYAHTKNDEYRKNTVFTNWKKSYQAIFQGYQSQPLLI